MRGPFNPTALLVWIAVLTNVALIVVALRLVGGGNFLRAMGSQVLPIPNRRIPQRGWLGGVCAGIAYRGRRSVRGVRAAALGLWFLSAGFAAAPYLFVWWRLTPLETAPTDFDDRTRGLEGDTKAWRGDG